MKSELKDPQIDHYLFQIVMSPKYPFRDPTILCLTDFGHPLVCLTDGRDLFHEIVGEGGWQIGHKLYTLVQLLPEFIHEMLLLDDDIHVVGTFHLAQAYDLGVFVNPGKSAVFMCKEQIDEHGSEFSDRILAVTPGAILLFSPVQKYQ